jgi:hypothetical protein
MTAYITGFLKGGLVFDNLAHNAAGGDLFLSNASAPALCAEEPQKFQDTTYGQGLAKAESNVRRFTPISADGNKIRTK